MVTGLKNPLSKIQRARSKRAFTLIELVVVILILAILAAMIVPRIIGRTGDAKRARALSDMATLSQSIDVFHADCDRYPTTQEGFSALQVAPSGDPNWHGPYLKKAVTTDPWGNEYDYQLVDDTHYSLRCYGKDGAPGGDGEDADIVEGDENQ